MDLRTRYDGLRLLGHSQRDAKHQAALDTLTAAEEKQLAQGLGYSEDEARQAAVHARQEIFVMLLYLDELSDLLENVRRWIIAGVIILVILVLRGL